MEKREKATRDPRPATGIKLFVAPNGRNWGDRNARQSDALIYGLAFH